MSRSNDSYLADPSHRFWVITLGLLFGILYIPLAFSASFLLLPIMTFITGLHFARRSFPLPMSFFLAACFMAVFHVVVPLPSQVLAYYRMERYALDPVGKTFETTFKGRIRTIPIKIDGNVLVEWHDSTVLYPTPFRRGVGCDDLCMTLLYLEDVATVTMSNIAPLANVDFNENEKGRAISSITYRRKTTSECAIITSPMQTPSSDWSEWELLRFRCFEPTGAESKHDYIIRHGWWSINQPVADLENPIDLSNAARANEFIVKFQQVRKTSGALLYRRFCTELHPIAPVLFISRTHNEKYGLGLEVARQRLATEWPCGDLQFEF